MKNALFAAAALIIFEAYAGFLPPEEKVLSLETIDPESRYTEAELLNYQTHLVEWDNNLRDLETSGAVNLNVFNQFHKKSKKWPMAMLGADMEVNEIAIFYIEENLTTPYHWDIKNPPATPREDEEAGPMGNYMNYVSHVFEIVSTEYRPKPTLPDVAGEGGIRLFAIRGRKPNEIEVPERVKAKLRDEQSKNVDHSTQIYPYVTPLNTDYLTLSLQHVSGKEAPIWTEDLEITVMSKEEYNLNLYLQ